MDATAPVAPVVAELLRIYASRCYALARLDGEVKLSFDSGESLRRWWVDGGDAWLRSYLPAADARGREAIALPPTPRTTLTLEHGPPHLRPLLCPLRALDDGSCGVETAGWRLRAAGAPQQIRSSDRYADLCATRARSDTSGALRYSVFRACLADGALTEALPLGAFQSPRDGWLIVTESVFIASAGCRERLSAYDLASGSAYLVGCRPGDSAGRLHVGRVPVGALREAAWMMMLHESGESVRPQVEWYDVPADFPIARRAGEVIPSRRISVDTSDAPVLEWAWTRDGKGLLSGRFDVSRSSLASYAAHLLQIADVAFQEGCAPLSAPRAIPWNELGPRVDPEARTDPAPLFGHVTDAKNQLHAAAPAKPGCRLVP